MIQGDLNKNIKKTQHIFKTLKLYISNDPAPGSNIILTFAVVNLEEHRAIISLGLRSSFCFFCFDFFFFVFLNI